MKAIFKYQCKLKCSKILDRASLDRLNKCYTQNKAAAQLSLSLNRIGSMICLSLFCQTNKMLFRRTTTLESLVQRVFLSSLPLILSKEKLRIQHNLVRRKPDYIPSSSKAYWIPKTSHQNKLIKLSPHPCQIRLLNAFNSILLRLRTP
jgi:hypothetical protein